MLEFENRWFEEFFDAIHLFTWILDPHGAVVKANQATQRLTNTPIDKVIGNLLWSDSWHELSESNRLALESMFEDARTVKTVRCDITISRTYQPDMVVNFSFKPILDGNQVLQFIFVEGRDITAYRQASEALNQSEARFKTIFEEAAVGIVIKNIDGKMLDCNPAFLAMLGYTAGEILQFDYIDLTYSPDRQISRKLFNELINGSRKNYIIEKRYVSKHGQPIWARITASVVLEPDQDAQFVIAIVENIQAHKEIENELSELQRRLMHSRERERLRLAQELHDGPLQELIDVTFQLKEMENHLVGEENLSQLHNVQLAIQELSRSIRTICGELRPPTLIPFGLEKTIRSHAEQFQEAHPELSIRLDLEEDKQTISEPIRIVLFRIYQAALNNILRHAQADQVEIQLKLADGQAILQVKDNGKGFELPERWINLARQGHLGIIGARERAKEVGGDLDVISKLGQGTIIQAVVPIIDDVSGYPGKEQINEPHSSIIG
jgi:PAS domain S-box-containing protein